MSTKKILNIYLAQKLQILLWAIANNAQKRFFVGAQTFAGLVDCFDITPNVKLHRRHLLKKNFKKNFFSLLLSFPTPKNKTDK